MIIRAWTWLVPGLFLMEVIIKSSCDGGMMTLLADKLLNSVFPWTDLTLQPHICGILPVASTEPIVWGGLLNAVIAVIVTRSRDFLHLLNVANVRSGASTDGETWFCFNP